jgi:flagellin-like protein
MSKVWAMRKNEEAVSPVIATILMVAITVVLAAVLYVMVLAFIITPPGGGVIGTVPDSDANNHLWRVTALGSDPILRSDVYVQLKNESGFVIQTELLSVAVGTHGFGYQAASTGDYVGVGDVFTLSRVYTQGTTITLVTLGATSQYCVLTV